MQFALNETLVDDSVVEPLGKACKVWTQSMNCYKLFSNLYPYFKTNSGLYIMEFTPLFRRGGIKGSGDGEGDRRGKKEKMGGGM